MHVKISGQVVQRDRMGKDQSRWLQRTYKELFGSIGKCGLFGRVLERGAHVDKLGLLIELGLEGLEKGIARHGAAAGTCGRLDGGGGCAVAEGVVGGELEGEARRRPPVCR